MWTMRAALLLASIGLSALALMASIPGPGDMPWIQIPLTVAILAQIILITREER